MKTCLRILLLLSNGLLCQNSLRWVHSFSQGAAEGLAIDLNSNSVFVGSFSGLKDFDGSSSSYTLNSQGYDAFILKSDRDGKFVSAQCVGGAGSESGLCVAIDKLGNTIVGGKFSGTSDFDPSATNALLSSNSTNLFIAKFGMNGSFKWATQASGTGYSECTAVVSDEAGNIYLTGEFSGLIDFDPGPATNTLSSLGQGDVYVLKLSSTGAFEWVRHLGGQGIEVSRTISLDSEGSIYIAGDFNQTVDFDPGSTSYTLTRVGGGYDSFICKLDSSGGFIWARQLQNTNGYSWASKLVIDLDDNFYLAGNYTGTIDCDPSPANNQLQALGQYDGFIAKYKSDGSLIWAESIEGTKQIFVHDAACDPNGNFFVAGAFSGKVDFDPGSASYFLTAMGNVQNYDYDAFVLAINGDGQFECASSFGGTAFNYAAAIAVDKEDRIICAGTFAGSVDFDPGLDSVKRQGDGGETLYISQFEKCTSLQTNIAIHGKDREVRVYPNPCTTTLEVTSTSQITEVMLFNSQGVVVLSMNVTQPQNIVIDVQSLPSGFYLLTLNFESGYMCKKIQIE